LGLLAAVVVAGAVWITRPTWYGVPVEAVAPTRGPIVATLVVSGRIQAADPRTLASTVAGRVVEVGPREGEVIGAGGLLVRLDETEARAAVARAEAVLAGLGVARDELEARRVPTAREGLRQAEASLAQARRDLSRDKSLLDRGALSPSALAQSELAVVLAESRARAAGIEARSKGTASAALEAQRAEAQAALEAAKARLEAHQIRAPVAQVILSRQVEAGEVVEPGRPLFELAGVQMAGHMSLVEAHEAIVIEPDEANLPKLVEGQSALVSPEAYPDLRLPAKVSRLGSAVDPRRGTFAVYLTLSTTELGSLERLRPDMTVSVELELSRKADALTVPRQAVVDRDVRPAVMTVVDGRAVFVPVTVGLEGDSRIEVTGLKPDALVILPSPKLPPEGARVRPNRGP
jgi:HlyD family secretion protein